MAISLSQLDVVSQAEQAFEFEVIDEASGKGIGVFISVLGGHSKTITNFVASKLNAQRRAAGLRLRKGAKEPEFTPVEDDIEFGIEAAAKRIVGWRGIAEEYTPENAFKLCESNPIIREQVMTASDDIKNFTKG